MEKERERGGAEKWKMERWSKEGERWSKEGERWSKERGGVKRWRGGVKRERGGVKMERGGIKMERGEMIMHTYICTNLCTYQPVCTHVHMVANKPNTT